MYEQQILVPNLNEIMTKYGENTKETVVVEKVHEKELQKKMGEEEVEVGKERKRKRGEDKQEEKGNGSEVDDLLSTEAFELVQKTLMKKGFIGERGFKEIIPPFKEVIEKRNWTSICTHLPIGLAATVREFYANLREKMSFSVM